MDDGTPDLGVGEWLTVPDVADRLGVDAGAVRRLLEERRLVGARRDGVLRVPGEFLVRDADGAGWRVLAFLQGTVTVLGDVGFSDEDAITWLFTHDDVLDASPIDALRAGRKTAVRRRAAEEL